MKRRRFLQALGAITAGSSVPAWLSPLSADTEFLDAIARLKRSISALRVPAGRGFYYVVMHPEQVEDLKHAQARWRWQEAWQRYRRAIRFGAAAAGWHPSYVLDYFGDGSTWSSRTLEGRHVIRAEPLTINTIRILGS